MRGEVAEPSYLAGLAALLGARWLIVFSAFWDASSSKHSDTYSISGYVFTIEQAKEFSQAWQLVLDGAGLKWFHTAACGGVDRFVKLVA